MQLPVRQARERGDAGPERHAGVDERLELLGKLEPADADSADLADLRRAGTEAGRLQVDDDVRRALEEEVAAERRREPDRVAVPREAGVGLDDVVEQRAGERDRGGAEGEEPPRRLVRQHRPAPLFDQLDEAVGRIEPELHPRESRRTYVRFLTRTASRRQ